MYRRILVPTDGSDLSLQALPYARLLAGAPGAELTLVRVVPSAADLMRIAGATPKSQWATAYDEWRRMAAGLRDKAAAELREAAGALSLNGRKPEPLVLEGDAADAIVQEAAGSEDTLVVMTTHGRSGITRWWLGSVADKVVRHSTAPVLIVRTEEAAGQTGATAAVRNLLVPLDGSELAEHALAHAVSLAKALGLQVRLVRAIDPLTYVEDDFGVYQDLLRDLEDDARAYVAGVVDRCRKEGVAATSLVMTGSAADVILETRDRMADPLVVMATHGRSGVGRWLLGSVTDKVVRSAEGPVLIIPTGREEQ